MQFELSHEFDIPLDALELAVISPALSEKLAQRLPNIESVQQKQHLLEESGLQRTLAFRANLRLPTFARAYVTPEMMGWDETSTYDFKRHASEWHVVPHVKPEWRRYFEARGVYQLTQLASGRTKRTVSGFLELRVPVFRAIAEKLIYGEMKKTFDAEAETLRDLATLT